MRFILRIFPIFIFLLILGCKNNTKQKQEEQTSNTDFPTIYQFTVTDINGDSFSFENLKGKKIMIVNTASKCGLTPQYEELEELYKNYKDKDFVIVGFPANDFNFQEPGDNSEIKEFCRANFNITFPMMSKISVKGDEIADVYKFLTMKSLNGKEDSEVEWNFQKYLIGRNGQLEKVINPRISPKNKEIISWITEE